MKSLNTYFGVIAILLILSCSGNRPIPGKSSITYNRTACYGTCPIYQMSIGGNGKAVFVGERFTEKIGTWEKQLDKQTCRELFDLFSSVSWDSMSSEYPAFVSDVPSTIFHYRHRSIDKEVVVTGEHPKIFDQLATRLNNIAVADGWTEITPN